jgi:uncharacterized protein involved in type VI secretion and phage assembly
MSSLEVSTKGAQIDIQVNGSPLSSQVNYLLASAEVDSTLSMPSQFRLVFRGDTKNVMVDGGLQLAVEVKLQVTIGGAPVPVMQGEITGVEVEYAPDGQFTIVRGLDKSHRMMRGTVTKAYINTKASDVVSELVGQAGISVGTISSTPTVYPWLTQANVSDWAFIQQLADLENCVAYADATGKFNFGPMTEPGSGARPASSYDTSPGDVELVMGKNLWRLRATVTGSEQVPQVNVRGFDRKSHSPVVGVAPATTSSSLSTDPGTKPAAVGGEFGAKTFLDTSRPFDTQASADTRAKAIAADISGSLVELEGQCEGDPSIVAGKVISLGMAGPPVDGQYVCSSARQVFEPSSGYTTWFTVSGRRQNRSLHALASGGTSMNGTRPSIPGVVIGSVTNVTDTEGQARVKVQFPWLSSTYESDWAPMVQIGAGKGGYGFLFVPEVGDEVLVAFDRGDVDHPYVIGNLYNSVNKPVAAPSIDASDGSVNSRRIMSRKRLYIQFDEPKDALAITVADDEQKVIIKLDAMQSIITMKSAGKINVEAGEGLAIKSGGPFSVEAGGAVSVKAGQGFSVDSAGDLSMAAASGAKVEAPTISLTGGQISLGA